MQRLAEAATEGRTMTRDEAGYLHDKSVDTILEKVRLARLALLSDLPRESDTFFAGQRRAAGGAVRQL